LLALHDPVALAEAFAVIDQVSGGRLDTGIGRGGMVEDYRVFGIPYEESWARIKEGIDLLPRCWSGETQHYHGRFRSVDGVRVTPRPVQQPYPPLFIAANSLETTLATARLGLPTLTSFYTPDDEIRRLRAAYRQESLQSGRKPKAVELALDESWGMCCVHVARDTATAIAAAADPFLRYRARLSDRPNTGRRLAHAGPRSLQEHLDTNTAMFGNPDEVAERLARYADNTGLTRLMLLVAIPGLPVADVLRSMELCAAHVLPQFTADHPRRADRADRPARSH
jgi:alkanesulfonate monooxygenase SsuD/methylene tetrahydromethanopterin reductase-like flavin-dependent oxidoreductase (luciferase family)